MDPVIFNRIKHHLGYIGKRINSASSTEELNEEVKHIGSSTLDLYTGDLSTDTIIGEICHQLRNNLHFTESDYNRWLVESEEEYRIQVISDSSQWTLLKGDIPGQYIHIHPARYSPHTLRVHANSLKTAILAVSEKLEASDVENINRLRQDFLELSPVKSIDSMEGLGKIMYLVRSSAERIHPGL